MGINAALLGHNSISGTIENIKSYNGILQVSQESGSTQLDAFGRLRTSDPNTLFDSQQEYGLDTLRMWDAVANGTYATGASNGSVTSASNSVGPRSANTRMAPITVSTTANHYAVLQSRQYIRYVPGKGHLVYITGIFAPDSTYGASIIRRSSTSGSVVDVSIPQAEWNIDKFNGTGPSKVTLDFTKTQILVIQAQWLGVGRVVVGFDVDGVLFPAHQFLNANNLTVPYTQSFNLPVRLETRNTTTTTTSNVGYFDSANGIFLSLSKTGVSPPGGTIYFICCSVQSEGGVEARGFPSTANNGITAIGVTTRRAVLSIRPKATYNSLTNRSQIDLTEYILSAATNNALYEIVIGGTLGGAPAWTSVDTNSAVEFDVAGTTVTGGKTLVSGYVLAGSGTIRYSTGGDVDIRNPLVLSQVDALAATQTPVSIVCTSLTGTSNILAAMNWHEQIV